MRQEDIAAAYLRHFESRRPEDSWAIDELDKLVRDDPAVAWEITRVLVNAAESDEALAYVAAGPLEDLLNKHGPAVIDGIEEESNHNAQLQLALSGVWGIDRSNPIFDRWYAILWKHGFAEGKRKPL